ncbi:amidase [Marinobacter sp.]|uniref:amidase n=1 Tax=Marinobacter sp. TaxID=50741 RepID=UPI00384C191A
MTALHYRPAHELVADLKSGALSSVQLTQALLERIREVNGDINAVVTLAGDAALIQAKKADERRENGEPLGALHGLPVTVKDTWEVAGMLCTAGAPKLSDYHPATHADVIERLTAAGAIIMGKTNVPIYAGDIQSYNRLFGVTRNPHNLERTSGGSSGGSAAATATGMTPLELGSDLAGSVRIPAHFCGVFGHKPSRAILSFRGHIPGPPGTLSRPDLPEGGPIARTARDLELMLGVIAGPGKLEARSWALNLSPSKITSLGEARVGHWLQDPLCPVEQSLTEAYEALASELEKAGAMVAPATHDLLSMEHIMPVYFNLLGSLLSVSLTPAQRRQMKWVARLEKLLRLFFPMTAGSAQFGRGVNQPVHDWFVWNEVREKMRSRIDELFQEFDVLLTPVTPTTAIPHDYERPVSRRRIQVNGESRAYLDQFCWIAMATLLGLPATTVPIGKSREGLPYSVQVIGAPGMDLTTLRFADLLEQSGLAGFVPPESYPA